MLRFAPHRSPRSRRIQDQASRDVVRTSSPASRRVRAPGPGARTSRAQLERVVATRGLRARHRAPRCGDLPRDDRGLRYAHATLDHLVAEYPAALPGLSIRTGPTSRARLHARREPRPRSHARDTRATGRAARAPAHQPPPALRRARLRVRAHEVVWRDASPLTPDDLRWLDALCRERGIELAANQNCFGHMGRWLAHPRVPRARGGARRLADARWTTAAPRRCSHPTPRTRASPSSCAASSSSTSRAGASISAATRPSSSAAARSRAEVEARGAGRVYVEHLPAHPRTAHADGCDVLFWGDMVRKHPEVVRELPRKATTASRVALRGAGERDGAAP